MIPISQAAMRRRKEEELGLTARVDWLFRFHPDDITSGYDRLEELSLAIVAAAGEMAFQGATDASQDARADVVDPFMAKIEKAHPGGAYLADGWDDDLGRALGLRIEHAAEEIEEARTSWLSSLRRQFEAWDLDGTPREAIESRLLADLRGELVGERFVYGRAFAAFRAAVKAAVATVTGHAWTDTWKAAFMSLQVRSDLIPVEAA